MLNQEIKNKENEIYELCEKHKVVSLFVFGSVLTENFKPESDIDMLVDIESNDPFTYTDYYFSLKENLEKLLNRPIDLLEKRALKNPNLIKNIEQNKQLIYGR